MTGHVCPECGVHRPGCACARAAETARAEDFDPLRIRPYVTLDAPEGPDGRYGAGADLQYGAGTGVAESGPDGQPTAHMPAYGAGPGPDGQQTTHLPAYAAGPGPDGQQTTHLPAYSTEDPPTAQLAAIRPVDLTAPADLTAPIPVAHEAYAGGAGPEAYAGGTGSEPYPTGPGPKPYPTHPGSEPYPDPVHPGASGDPSETMPLLLRGVGDVPPGHGQARARRRRRGVMAAAVTAVAVAGTAALAAVVLGGADDTDDRAAVPEVTTSASLNVAVSEAPSPSSETPEPTTSSPTPERTTASPSPSPSTATASPSASTSKAAPPAAVPSEAPTTAAPTTATPSAQPTEETAVTLSLGSKGDEVVELQMRLTLAGAYHDKIDGKYDQDVWRAVKNYQSWMYIEGDPKGVYGPNTREALERSTSLQ
ncbi:peptidoglycan-binding protein [Streptomyces sp. NPDC008122]|uniref:peptidoglycan-binding protein n=1 Tax=Streptomyces sp. NPDC008122 TaxID=3364810 RepID=UPI0036E359A6